MPDPFRHAERPRRSVTGRERVGENLIDLPFLDVDVLGVVVLAVRPVSLIGIMGACHVRLPFAF